MASSYARLEVTDWPSAARPVQPGVPVPLTVVKLDWYGQVMASDSVSLIQAEASAAAAAGASESSESSESSGPAAEASDSSVASLSRGVATVPCIFKFAFARVEARAGGATALAGAPRLRLRGIDSETLGEVATAPAALAAAHGDAVCPPGWVLSLEAAAAGDSDHVPWRWGTCQECPFGTYSLSPLVGESPAGPPACLGCPHGATCPGGGRAATLAAGTWAAAGGRYLLVACPAGHQLVNSVQGAFSHDVQRCVPCAAGAYVVNSSNPSHSCQPCPVGAACDGARLTGLVPGAVWAPDQAAGLYILTSCPAGYELVNTLPGGDEVFAVAQQCGLCPSMYYCPGGAGSRRPCPAGTFSRAGSNASGACEAAVLVAVEVRLAVAKADFDSDAQRRFREALALAAGTNVEYVVLVSITDSRRATAGGDGAGVHVATQIAAKDAAAASRVSSALTQERLNTGLANVGFPAATIVAVTVQEPPDSMTTSSWPAIGAAIGAGGALLIGVAAMLLYLRNKRESEEERTLRLAICEVREAIQIRQRDGFILSTERPPLWRVRARDEYVVLQKGYVEAAARLHLMQEFDLNQFDALCLSLECGSSATSEPSPSYSRLCDWLLDLSLSLIRPDSSSATGTTSTTPDRHGTADGKDHGRGCRLRPEERFPYFVKRVCRVRVWADSRGELFGRLQRAAAGFMDDIAALCDQRYQEMREELGGAELLNFDPELQTRQIRRQDDEQVYAIRVNEDARREQRLASDLERMPSMSDGLGEDVFIAQLRRRAVLLNQPFQERILSIVFEHSINPQFDDNDFTIDDLDHTIEVGGDDCQGSSSTDETPSNLHGNLCFAVDDPAPATLHPVLTARALDHDAATESAAHPLLESASNSVAEAAPSAADSESGSDYTSVGPGYGPRRKSYGGAAGVSSRGRVLKPRRSVMAESEWGTSGAGRTRSRELECNFAAGQGTVVVCSATPKGETRMREKLAEYRAEGADWPLTACILDPVRASIVCEGPVHMVEVAEWFVGRPNGPDGSPSVEGVMPVCKVKNKFALDRESLVGGYRDLLLCVVFHGPEGLRIVGEIQIHDKTLHDLKLLMHKLYRILRAKVASVV